VATRVGLMKPSLKNLLCNGKILDVNFFVESPSYQGMFPQLSLFTVEMIFMMFFDLNNVLLKGQCTQK